MPTLWPWAMTLTLDFQGQILKLLYLRNGRADWHGTKEMWVDRMLDSHCDLNFDLTHAIDLGFWRSVFEIALSQEREGQSTWKKGNASRYDVIPTMWPWLMTLTLNFEGQILKSSIIGIRGWIYMEPKGCESIGCWTQVVTKVCPHPWPWPWIFKV